MNTGGGINVNAESFDDRLTRGGPGGYGRANVNGWHYVNTDDRRLVSVFSNFNFYYDGRSHNYSVSPGVSLRPTAAFSAEFGVSYESRLDDAQWVNAVTAVDGTTHYVFGRLDQKTSSITARVNYTMTPNLSVQVYAQPFVSSGLYEQFKELVERPRRRLRRPLRAVRVRRLAGLQGLCRSAPRTSCAGSTSPAPRCSSSGSRVARASARLNGFRYGQDFGDVFSTPSSNTFLVKLAYWLNP